MLGHKLSSGTDSGTSYLCKTMAHRETFRGPIMVFRKLQVAHFYSVLPNSWEEHCSSPCIVTGCALLIQTAKQLLCSARELLFYCNMTETQILTINKQIWITRNQQMKTHKLARQISTGRDQKPTAQKELNLLTQHTPDSGSEQGSSHLQNAGSVADPSFVRCTSAAATTPSCIPNQAVNSPSACMLTSQPVIWGQWGILMCISVSADCWRCSP